MFDHNQFCTLVEFGASRSVMNRYFGKTLLIKALSCFSPWQKHCFSYFLSGQGRYRRQNQQHYDRQDRPEKQDRQDRYNWQERYGRQYDRSYQQGQTQSSY